MTGLKRRLSVAVLLTLLISSNNLVLSQSSPNDEDKIDVVRAVLEAELARQASTFEYVRQLSTENIAKSISMGVAADLKLTPLSRSEITEKAYSMSGAHYLRFKSFNIEDGHAIVSLSMISEAMVPCFGPAPQDPAEFHIQAGETRWSLESRSNQQSFSEFHVCHREIPIWQESLTS